VRKAQAKAKTKATPKRRVRAAKGPARQTQEILIEARTPTKRVALLEEGRLMEIYYEDPRRPRRVGNIYKGVIKDVLSGISAAFIDVGEPENFFLAAKELNEAILRAKGYRRGQAFPIGKVLKGGQQLIVQVKREGIGEKNPQATTRISLAGRYWVFLPKDGRLGVSRRIEDPKEAQRLKAIARELKREDEGLIARTAAARAKEEDLERDFNYLLGTWKGIEEKAERVSAPALLYRGIGLIKTILRDRLVPEVARVVVDDEKTLREIEDFLKYLHLEGYLDRLELYGDERPLFEMRGIEAQLRESLQPKVKLPSGGSLVIAETEALTAIDVNTGGDTRHRTQEQAILHTNLEAAVEIPRQLRLRKISGIIVVDFIDMRRKEHIQQVIERLKGELKKDRVPADFIDITELGLAEITRKREGESLMEMLGDGELGEEEDENGEE
jgi:ribonuclease G